MQNLLPDLVSKDGLISLIIGGRSDALDDLCLHWFFGHHLKERTSNQAIFLLEEQSIQVIEPQSLKETLVAVAAELMEYYQL